MLTKYSVYFKNQIKEDGFDNSCVVSLSIVPKCWHVLIVIWKEFLETFILSLVDKRREEEMKEWNDCCYKFLYSFEKTAYFAINNSKICKVASYTHSLWKIDLKMSAFFQFKIAFEKVFFISDCNCIVSSCQSVNHKYCSWSACQ